MTRTEAEIIAAMRDAVFAISPCRPKEAMRAALAAAQPLIERQARDKALDEAANAVASLAERPFDNEPEFSAVMFCEAAILDLKATL